MGRNLHCDLVGELPVAGYTLLMSARFESTLVRLTDNAASGIESDSNSNDGVDRAAEEG